RHDLAPHARELLWQSRVEKEISGGAPNWKLGHQGLLDAIQANSDLEHSDVRFLAYRTFAERIALGAADTAATHPAAAAKPRELLAIAEEARKMVARYVPEGKVPPEKAAAMSSAIEKAEASILKQETFDALTGEIEQSLRDKKPMAAIETRFKLISLYPDFETNRKVAALLAEALKTEQELVSREELDKEAVAEDRPSTTPAPLTLSPHTRSRTDEPSGGRTVCALAADCSYGIDSVTGEPVWRRVIGLDTPFFPVAVTTSVPGLLMFDTRFGELLVVDQRTGELLWRQPLEEAMSGAPLVHEGQIYAPTLGNHLYKIDLESGRNTTRLTFSQKTLSPPALVSGGDRLVVPGEQAMFYTLTTRPLACTRVDYTAHKTGTITAPLVTMGGLILTSLGVGEEKSQLRVLDARADADWLKEVAAVDIAGRLRDAPTIRGKELFVPSSGERITAFTVSDDPGQRLLTQVATLEVQTPHPGPMFLSPGPDGQLWFSGSAIRKLQVKTESIRLDPAELAAGTSTQPLQNIGQYLYLGRRLPYSSTVLFTQADRESMSGLWRIVLGSRILASSFVADGNIVCVTEAGDVYLVTKAEIDKGGFKRTSNSQLKIPADLNEPLRATTLRDGRIAVDCGGSQPQLWIISQTAQVEQQVKLEQPLEAPPVLLGEGIVLPLPGRLRMLRGGASSGKVEDYLTTVDKEKTTRWIHAASADESELIAVDDQGRLVRVQFRSSPVPHLAEVAARKLSAPVDVPFAVKDSRILLAGSDGSLQMLDGASLETESEAKLEQPAASALAIIGERLFVETGGSHLACFDIKNELQQIWKTPLEGTGLSGPPARFRNLLIISQRDGQVRSIDPSSGESRANVDIGQPIVLGPQSNENSLLITTVDGSLRRVESVVETQP
ncbi:MAG: PQQ-binding-like beta-propeller repeat protein, partial [Planctomycetaceae bacterium]